MVKHYTARGELIDMGAIASKHANAVAIGNAQMNARGDIVDNKGVVLRTQEQIEAEWKKNKENMINSVGVSEDIKQPLPNGAMAQSKKLDEDQEFDPFTNGEQVQNLVKQQIENQPKRRKMIDSEK